MSNAQRKFRRQRQRRRTQRDREIPPDQFVGGAEAVDLMNEIHSETLMPCRTTFLDDPMFTRGGAAVPLTGYEADGTPQLDRSGTVDPVPVALFEPERIMGVFDHRTGTAHDGLTTAIIGAGFQRVPDAPIWAARPADGWGLYRTTDGLMLRDRTGGVWAAGRLALDPLWVSTATSYGGVVVFYGPKLGVRVPPDQTPSSYTVQDKIDEFREGRRYGMCAVATVKWHPAPNGQTVGWVLFGPGSFGQPLPVAYVPQHNFDAYGGPEAFGFVPIDQGGLVGIPTAEHLVVETTHTDVDVLQTDVDPKISFVAGYHVRDDDGPPPWFSAWRQAADTYGLVLILTGHQDMPVDPDTLQGWSETTKQMAQVLRDSYAAVVSTHRGSRP